MTYPFSTRLLFWSLTGIVLGISLATVLAFALRYFAHPMDGDILRIVLGAAGWIAGGAASLIYDRFADRRGSKAAVREIVILIVLNVLGAGIFALTVMFHEAFWP